MTVQMQEVVYKLIQLNLRHIRVFKKYTSVFFYVVK
jgi:hypothetical protein